MTPTVRIQKEEFDLAHEVALLAQAAPGAVASFTGFVRAEEGLTSLSLEHYPGMTEREIGRHVEEAEKRWPLLGVTVIHRIGELKPGECIVLVAAAALHRREAFAACEFLMDHLKTQAPFWKKEIKFGETHWVEAEASDQKAKERWKD
jgi:molybdopterin synthase catalytic subunit